MKKNNENLVQDNFYEALWMDSKAKPVGAPPTLSEDLHIPRFPQHPQSTATQTQESWVTLLTQVFRGPWIMALRCVCLKHLLIKGRARDGVLALVCLPVLNI